VFAHPRHAEPAHIERLLGQAGGNAQPTLESNSMILLYSHVRTGRWASVMPAQLATTLGLTDVLRAIPIVELKRASRLGLWCRHANR